MDAPLLASQLGSPSAGPLPCSGNTVGISSGVSLLRFGRSIPFLELFEAFIVVGLVLIAVSTSTYYTFRNMTDVLKADGGTPSSVNIANSAAAAVPVWIGIGVLIFIMGIIFYYLHRRFQDTPI